MKTLLPVLLLCLTTSAAFAQNATPSGAPPGKGITPLSAPSTNSTLAGAGLRPVTRAVVVGISDYQDPVIPDLKFADRDAEAFAAWLQSPAGGSVPADNIQLLINEKATSAQIGLSLDWLLELQEGDVAIIYFSGHGDLDSKKRRDQWGFLLTYDTQASIYISASCPLYWLQNTVSTLSIDQKVKVELFLDACHAGKLAGSATGGRQTTAQALAQPFANEVKLLSCQPSEYSLEGTQWGGGRGVFSYHLIEGLSGSADVDRNGQVNLKEIGRYLEDRVPAETAPVPQTPLFFGERNTVLAVVDASSPVLPSHPKPPDNNLVPVEIKGLEDEVLSNADSLERWQYHSFKNAIRTHALLEPEGGSADFFYKKLIENERFKPIAGLMRRNFAAALADDAQQALNAILSDDPFEINAWTCNPAKYKQYPLELERALELIGEHNYLYRSLLAKKLYFEGYNLFNNLGALLDHPALRDSFRLEAKKRFDLCLDNEPGAAYAWYSIGNLLDKTGDQAMADSNIACLKRAIELAPNWKQPYVAISEVYINWLVQLDNANEWLMKAYSLDTTSYLSLLELSWLRQYQHRPEEANAICRRLIAMRPELSSAYYTMGTTLLFLQAKVSEAGEYFQQAWALDTAQSSRPNGGGYARQAYVLMKTRQLKEAVTLLETLLRNEEDLTPGLRGWYEAPIVIALVQLRDYEKALKIINEEQNTYVGWLTLLQEEKGRILLLQHQLDAAEKTLLHALTLDQSDDDAWIWIWALLGSVKAAQNLPDEAEAYFKKATSFPGGNTANYYWEEAWFRYGHFLLAQNRDGEAAQAFEKTEEVYPNGYYAPYGQALCAAKKGRQSAALDWLEKSLDRYYPVPQPLFEEPLFHKLRQTKRFKALIAKHFPDFKP